MISLTVQQIADKSACPPAGADILLSGTVYTARDAAHRRLIRLIEEGKPLPIELEGAVIYYAGPTQTKPGMFIGSCGPTTSGRLDPFAPTLYGLGVAATIGKGRRNAGVCRAIAKHKALYLCAMGGCGALMARCVTGCEIVAFEDLGCEAIRRLTVVDFPLIVGVDRMGNDVFEGR